MTTWPTRKYREREREKKKYANDKSLKKKEMDRNISKKENEFFLWNKILTKLNNNNEKHTTQMITNNLGISKPVSAKTFDIIFSVSVIPLSAIYSFIYSSRLLWSIWVHKEKKKEKKRGRRKNMTY